MRILVRQSLDVTGRVVAGLRPAVDRGPAPPTAGVSPAEAQILTLPPYFFLLLFFILGSGLRSQTLSEWRLSATDWADSMRSPGLIAHTGVPGPLNHQFSGSQ
jgi:hypothetical protein